MFLSSTFRELASYRRAVDDKVRAAGLDARVELVLLESTTARVVDAPTLCRTEVERSDLVVVLLGDELGSRPSDRALSYTELEVQAAIDTQVPVLGFILPPGAAVHPVDPDTAGWDRLPTEGLDIDPARRRQQDLRARVRAIVGTEPGPARQLADEAQVADAVVEALVDWLDVSARPRRVVLPGRASMPFVGYDREYRTLRHRCLDGWPTVVSGPPGAGKSTLVQALVGDPDVERAHPSGVHHLVMAVDDTGDLERWGAQVRGVLDAAGAEVGAPALVAVALTWVVPVGSRTAATDVVELVETVFEPLVPAAPSARRCTLVFEVAEPVCATAVCHALGMADDETSHVAVRGWDPPTAVAYLRRRGGLHPAPCALCDELGDDLVRALDCNPVLLHACVHDLASWAATRGLHEHLRRVERLPVARRSVAALWERVDGIGVDAWLVLDHAAAVLPKPFSFPEEAIVASAGSSIGEDRVRSLLDALADRGWLEVVGAGSGFGWDTGGLDALGLAGPVESDDAGGGLGDPRWPPDAGDGSLDDVPWSDQRWFTIHPLIAEVARRRHKSVAPGRGEATAARCTERLWSWFDEQVDELLEASSYRTWQLLEEPAVQALLCQWFHLLVEVTRQAPAIGPSEGSSETEEGTSADGGLVPTGAQALARLYAKALWWWGLYVPFELCETLAALGARVVHREAQASEQWDRLVAVASAVEHLHRAWPREGAAFAEHPPPSSGSWPAAQRALADVAAVLAIDLTPGAGSTLEPDAGRVVPRPVAAQHGGDRGVDRAVSRRVAAQHEVTKLLHTLWAHTERGRLADVAHRRARRAADDDGVRSAGAVRRSSSAAAGSVDEDTRTPDAVVRSVDRHYDAALHLADDGPSAPDRWNAAWFAYERSDAAIDALVQRCLGDPRWTIGPRLLGPDELAEATWWVDQAVARLDDHHEDGDLELELLANVHRLAADVAWWAGDRLRCWQCAVRAVAHAYWFMVDPVGEPDFYTSTLYREHRWRAAGYLGDLCWSADQGDQEVVADPVDGMLVVAARAFQREPDTLRRAVAAWWRQRPIAPWPDVQWELADLLFPVGLAEADVVGRDIGSRSVRRRFSDEVRRTVAAARVELPDLGTTAFLRTAFLRTASDHRTSTGSQVTAHAQPGGSAVSPGEHRRATTGHTSDIELLIRAPGGGDRYLEQLYELMQVTFPPDELGGPWEDTAEPGDLPVVVAVDPAGDVVGGAVGEHYPDAGVVLLSYLVVDAACRSGGVGGALLEAARRTWSPAGSDLILAEIEDPRFHGAAAGQDPFRRIAFYARHGVLVIDGPYFQPRLRPTSHRVPHLLLCVVGADQAHFVAADRLAAGPIHRFLEQYFEGTEGPGTADGDVHWLLDHYRQASVPVVPIERFAATGIWHCSDCRHTAVEDAGTDKPG